MTINVGDKLPEATFLTNGTEGPAETTTAAQFGTGKSVLFGMPGAFTSTCSGVHLPSIVAAAEAMRAKGVETIAVMTVNDPFVQQAWAEAHDVDSAGVVLLADPEAAFTKAMGLDFSFPPRGLIDRSKRFAAIIEDGVVKEIDVEENPGACDLSGGAAILEKL